MIKKSNLVPLNKNPNSKYSNVTTPVYVKLLEEYLPTIMDSDTIFIQDNAFIYTVHVIKIFFEKMGYTSIALATVFAKP